MLRAQISSLGFFVLPSVNADNTKYMVMSQDQNAGQNGDIQIGNKCFETVEEFK
jgi:hypothetical protein